MTKSSYLSWLDPLLRRLLPPLFPPFLDPEIRLGPITAILMRMELIFRGDWGARERGRKRESSEDLGGGRAGEIDGGTSEKVTTNTFHVKN